MKNKRVYWPIIVIIFMAWHGSHAEELHSVQAYNALKIGENLPSFRGISDTGKEIGPTTPEGAFFIHFINDELPATCLDEECGQEAQKIVSQGGHLLGGSDGKYAHAFGIEVLSTSPWKLTVSLMVVADHEGIILAIYPQASLSMIEHVLIDLQL